MAEPIPDTMQAVRAESTREKPDDAVRALRVETVPVPRPGKGQVLVRMRAAPCNPADLLYITGKYGIHRPLPASLGFEGAGEVVAAGGGFLSRYMLGKRVACGGHDCTGTWATYCVCAANQCIPLDKKLSFEVGATALVNPMTALALVATVRKGGHRALVQNAAAGHVGKMVDAIARAQGLHVVNVVRRAAQAEALKGSDVLASEAPDFDAELARRCKEKNVTAALDAVAGRETGRLLSVLGDGGEVIIYGALSGQRSGEVEPMDMCFGHKRVRGFELAGYLAAQGLIRAFRLASAAQAMVAKGEVHSEVRERVPLVDAIPALERYVREMSAGKVLLMP